MLAGRFSVDLLAEQQRLDGVCASAERQCLLTSAREATGSQSVRCWSHRKAVAHYLAAALTISTRSPQALAPKAPMRGTVKRKYIIRLQLYTVRHWTAISDLSCCRVAPDSAEIDLLKKSTLVLDTSKTAASVRAAQRRRLHAFWHQGARIDRFPVDGKPRARVGRSTENLPLLAALCTSRRRHSDARPRCFSNTVTHWYPRSA